MIRLKKNLGHKKFRRSVWLVLSLFILFCCSLQSAAGSAYYSMVKQAYATVSSPPIILKEGNCSGTSTIYTSNTSAKVSVSAPLGGDGSSNAMIAYGEGTVTTPRYRLWNGSAWSAEASDGGMSANIQHVILKSCPIRNEKILGVLSSAGYLDVSVWNGATQTWSSPNRLASVGTTIDDYRLFDVAYEQVSGRGIVVYNPSSTGVDPKFIIWNGSGWSSSQTIDIDTTGVIYWIKLASKPSSDEIAMITLDANKDVYGMIWNGSTWGNGLTLENDASFYSDECIAVEYMQVSKDAMFIWSQPTGLMQYRTWNGTWRTESEINIAGTGNVQQFSLKADPNSDKLIAVSICDEYDLNTARWNGTAWTADAEHDLSVGGQGTTRSADAEFETLTGHEGHILLAFNTQDPQKDNTRDSLRYKHWNGTAWDDELFIDPYPALTDQYWVQLRRDADGKIWVGMIDDQADLHVWYWNGTDWIWSGAGLGEIETEVPGYSYEAFMIAPDAHSTATPATYDHVLKIVNQDPANWTVNLKVYGNSSINRLSSLNISLHDDTSSDQIIVSGGTITQPEGALYDLAGNATIYISMSGLQANASGTSYIHAHLKILTPNTYTYTKYVITFEIT